MARERGVQVGFPRQGQDDRHPPGADWERTLYREVEQSQAVIIIQTPNWLASKWCFAEFTQARALGKAIFPAIVAPTGDTLISPDIQALNLLSDRDGGLERLKRELVRIALDAQGGFELGRAPPALPRECSHSTRRMQLSISAATTTSAASLSGSTRGAIKGAPS